MRDHSIRSRSRPVGRRRDRPVACRAHRRRGHLDEGHHRGRRGPRTTARAAEASFPDLLELLLLLLVEDLLELALHLGLEFRDLALLRGREPEPLLEDRREDLARARWGAAEAAGATGPPGPPGPPPGPPGPPKPPPTYSFSARAVSSAFVTVPSLSASARSNRPSSRSSVTSALVSLPSLLWSNAIILDTRSSTSADFDSPPPNPPGRSARVRRVVAHPVRPASGPWRARPRPGARRMM